MWTWGHVDSGRRKGRGDDFRKALIVAARDVANEVFLTEVEEITRLVPTPLAVALVCEGVDGTRVCPVDRSEAARLVDWVRAGDPSIDPGYVGPSRSSRTSSRPA